MFLTMPKEATFAEAFVVTPPPCSLVVAMSTTRGTTRGGTTIQPWALKATNHNKTNAATWEEGDIGFIDPAAVVVGTHHQTTTADTTQDGQLEMLQRENDFLKRQLQELAEDKERLERRVSSDTLIIETFEGENYNAPVYDADGSRVRPLKWFQDDEDGAADSRIMDRYEECDLTNYNGENGDDVCPIDPDVSFPDALRDRAYWLVGLLSLQSCSGFILANNEILLQRHPVIIFFLTMLVGAGGNAGNQASVRVIRGLALGTLNDSTQQQFLNREFKMAVALSAILSTAGFIRAIVFRTPFAETVAITTALSLIVFSSICLGAVLPLFLKKLGVDPAHSSTSIQVVMDILGVLLTVLVSTAVLDSSTGQWIISSLSSIA